MFVICFSVISKVALTSVCNRFKKILSSCILNIIKYFQVGSKGNGVYCFVGKRSISSLQSDRYYNPFLHRRCINLHCWLTIFGLLPLEFEITRSIAEPRHPLQVLLARIVLLTFQRRILFVFGMLALLVFWHRLETVAFAFQLLLDLSE